MREKNAENLLQVKYLYGPNVTEHDWIEQENTRGNGKSSPYSRYTIILNKYLHKNLKQHK